MIDLPEYLEDEWYIVRYSGEIPEIAYHSSIYFLTRAKEGPGLSLNESDYSLLQDAAETRFQEIILRDLLPENRDTSIYRGIQRSIINYGRYQKFCMRQQLKENRYAMEVAEKLLTFLQTELNEVKAGVRQSAVNCSFLELCSFAAQLGLSQDDLPDETARLCLE